MKYYSQTSKYIAKNGFYILPFTILPAMFLAFSLNQASILNVFNAIASGSIKIGFTDIFRTVSLLNFASWWNAIFAIVGIVLLIVCVSMLMAFLDKHMRIGKRSYAGIFSKVNDNLLSTGFIVLLIVLFYQLWALVTSAVFYLCTFIESVPLAYAAAVIIYIASHVLLVCCISMVYLWLPCLQHTGFRTGEAFRISHELLSPVKARIVCTQVLTFLFIEAIISATVILIPSWIVTFVVATALYAVLIMVFFVRMQIVYFDRAGIEREDLKKVYFRR